MTLWLSGFSVGLVIGLIAVFFTFSVMYRRNHEKLEAVHRHYGQWAEQLSKAAEKALTFMNPQNTSVDGVVNIWSYKRHKYGCNYDGTPPAA